MNYFEDYKNAYSEMNADVAVVALREQINQLESRLAAIEKPYADRMKLARQEIEALVMTEQKSVELSGVKASYRKGRRSTSWASLAKELEPSTELVQKYTKIGKPSISISVVEGDKQSKL